MCTWVCVVQSLIVQGLAQYMYIISYIIIMQKIVSCVPNNNTWLYILYRANSQLRCMCGPVYWRKEGLGCAFLRGLWRRSCLWASLRARLYRSSPMFFPKSMDLCKMTWNTSGYAADWMKNNSINNWWKTPAEAPDLNPIENIWHELKEFIRREAKLTTKPTNWRNKTILENCRCS